MVPGRCFGTAGKSSSLFGTALFGADGAAVGGGISYGLALSLDGIGSGLFALGAGGNAGTEITLSQSGNVITGSVGADAYFTISIVPATGAVTFTQSRNIWHPTPGATHDEAATLTLNGVGEFLRITQAVTDGDGDTHTTFRELGTGVFVIEDAGPTLNVTKADDTAILLTTQDAETIGAGVSDSATSTANFNGAFALASSDYGSDGAGTAPALVYALAITGTPDLSGLVDSGLDSNGVQINLYDVGGVIVGSTALVAPAAATAASVVFSISVATDGVVTLTQFAEIDHAVEGTTTSPFDDQFADFRPQSCHTDSLRHDHGSRWRQLHRQRNN